MKKDIMYVEILQGEYANALRVIDPGGNFDLDVFRANVCRLCLWIDPGPRVMHQKPIVKIGGGDDEGKSGAVYELACHGLGTRGGQIEYAKCAKKINDNVVEI